jgi:hypothetical protein
VGLLIIRAVLVLAPLVGAAFVFRRPKATFEFLRKFFLHACAAENLAILRIIMFWTIFTDARTNGAVWFAELPASLREAPLGWGWLQDSVILEPRFIAVGVEVQRVAALCATIGLATRISAPTAVLAAVYAGIVATFFNKISHGMHLAVLCALVLAVSPCGDAISIDRLWKRFRGYAAPAPAAAYGLAVRICWMLLGTTYLFPGFWKLWRAGDLWFTGDRLRFYLMSRWDSLPEFVPPFRLDQYPILLAVLGSMTVIVETAFIFAIFSRAGRVICALSMAGFHLGVKAFMSIRFPAYMPLILLLDFPHLWDEALRRLPSKVNTLVLDFVECARAGTAKVAGRAAAFTGAATRHLLPARRFGAAAALGTALFAAQMVAGFAEIVSFPISVYPQFSVRKRSLPKVARRTRLYFEAQTGQRVDLRDELSRMGPARTRKLFQRLTKAKTAEERRRSSRALIDVFRHLGADVKPGDEILVVEESWQRFPLGERKGHGEVVKARYRVTERDSLKLISGDSEKRIRSRSSAESARMKDLRREQP